MPACMMSRLLFVISSGLIRDFRFRRTGSDSAFSQRQMSVLSQGLSLTKSLERLSITGNLSVPSVGEHFVEVFERNTTLKRLELRLARIALCHGYFCLPESPNIMSSGVGIKRSIVR